jgi:hypothetical protein
MIVNFWLIIEILKYAPLIVWTSYSMNVVLGLIGRAFFILKKSDSKTEKLELVLVSIANKKMRNSARETINYTKSNFKGVSFNIVVDGGAELLH